MANKRYVKVNRDILVEWTYDDQNLIAEDYKVLAPDGNTIQSFAYSQAPTTFSLPSVTNNLLDYQLFSIDPVNRKYGNVDPNTYTFLHIQDYPAGVPVAHDIVKFWFPINYTFNDKLGMYVRIYTYDYNNQEVIELSNFYFDKTDPSQSSLLDFPSQPLNLQEVLWGKCIQLQIPSVHEVALQRTQNAPEQGTINSNITGGVSGVGLSQTSPIFIDFSFIERKETVLGADNFFMGGVFTANVPQAPEFKTLGVSIEESDNGDFFEIVGTYNGNSSEFQKFINDMANIGQVYYVQYDITMFEENVPQATEKRLITNNFSEPIEYRPVIKRANTTAAIQVTMHLVNLVDETQISRTATLGLLRDQISKYGARLLRINTSNTFKPKIYNDSNADVFRKGVDGIQFTQNKFVEKVEIPFPAIALDSRIVIQNRSEEAKDGKYYGKGLLKLPIRPFDNIFKFSVSKKIQDNNSQPYDLTNAGQIKLAFRGKAETIEADLYYDSGEVNLELGVLVFKIDESKVAQLEKMYSNGENLFYITTSNNGIRTTIYDGRFMPDSSQEYRDFVASQEEEADNTTNLINVLNQGNNNTGPTRATNVFNRFTSRIKAPKVTIANNKKSVIVKKVDVSSFKKLNF
jgi:hypothetical protein